MKNKELNRIEKEFQSSWPVMDELEHDLHSKDPLMRERAFRIFKERFRLVFHLESCEYRIILRGGEVSVNEDGCELINNDCNIREYLLLRNTMGFFNLVPTMANLKTAFDYSRKVSKVSRILINNPDANDKIKAYELSKKAFDALSEIFNIQYPEVKPLERSIENYEQYFKYMQ
jgi:hypothetical protein